METILPVERTLTRSDFRCLKLLRAQQSEPAAAEALEELLDGSEVLAGPAVPASLVTIGSRVLLQDPRRAVAPWQLTLCEPGDASPSQGRISVLSPVGAALVGLRAGQVARWRMPGGREGEALIVAVLSRPDAEAA